MRSRLTTEFQNLNASLAQWYYSGLELRPSHGSKFAGRVGPLEVGEGLREQGDGLDGELPVGHWRQWCERAAEEPHGAWRLVHLHGAAGGGDEVRRDGRREILKGELAGCGSALVGRGDYVLALQPGDRRCIGAGEDGPREARRRGGAGIEVVSFSDRYKVGL